MRAFRVYRLEILSSFAEVLGLFRRFCLRAATMNSAILDQEPVALAKETKTRVNSDTSGSSSHDSAEVPRQSNGVTRIEVRTANDTPMLSEIESGSWIIYGWKHSVHSTKKSIYPVEESLNSSNSLECSDKR